MRKRKKTYNVTLAILCGLVLGILFGWFMPGRYEFLLPVITLISGIYMNALRLMIFPLVFCSLIVGIQGIGSISATGRIGGQSVLYYVATTLFASLLPWVCSAPLPPWFMPTERKPSSPLRG